MDFIIFTLKKQDQEGFLVFYHIDSTNVTGSVYFEGYCTKAEICAKVLDAYNLSPTLVCFETKFSYDILLYILHSFFKKGRDQSSLKNFLKYLPAWNRIKKISDFFNLDSPLTPPPFDSEDFNYVRLFNDLKDKKTCFFSDNLFLFDNNLEVIKITKFQEIISCNSGQYSFKTTFKVFIYLINNTENIEDKVKYQALWKNFILDTKTLDDLMIPEDL